MIMRPSFSLAVISLLTSFAYGFSSQSGRWQLRQQSGGPATNAHATLQPAFLSRGGAAAADNKVALNQATQPVESSESKCPVTGSVAILGSIWGAGGVLYILAKAIKRVLPIALEPFQAGAIPMGKFQLGAYIFTCLWFAYVEGYKGFQTKFAPLVVTRSFTLVPGKNGTKWFHFFLAPFYSMGLIHATRKRKIVSWSVSIGVAVIVAAVKRLPYPYRNIIDAGVVTGLSWGSISIAMLYARSWLTGKPPTIDAALPEAKKAE